MATNVVQDRLGDLFVREGLITEEQLQAALKEAKQTKTRIGYALVKLEFVKEDELTRALAKQFRVPAVDLDKVKIEEKILKLIPEDVALKHRVLPLRKVGRTLTVAMANPLNIKAIEDIELLTKGNVQAFVSTMTDINNAINKFYAKDKE